MQTITRFLRRVPRAALFALALGLPSLCLGANPVLDRVVEQGVLKVAMSGEQQPFNFVYGKKKSVIGYDVELAESLAGLMKVKLEVVKLPFDQLIGALQDGRADMVISGMTITASRTRDVSFIGPYMLSGKSMLVSDKIMSKVKTPADLNSSDIKLAALRGSTSESLIREELPRASLTLAANYDEAVDLLLAGDVNGMVADMPILALTRQKNRDANLQLIRPPLSVEPLGIAIAKGDEQFENLLRNYLLVFEKTGLLLNLHKKWFEIGNSKIYEP